MDIRSACTSLNKIMKEEISLLQQFYDAEKDFQRYIQDKNWKKLQEIIESLDPLSISISLAEQERARIFNILSSVADDQDEKTFYTVISRVPEEWKDILGKTFRKLKLLVLKVQGLNTGINALVCTLSTTLQSILEEMYPHRRGRIYSNTGKTKSVSVNPMILNKQL